MKAIILTHHGEEGNLQLVTDFSIPKSQHGEVIVDVNATTVNHVDLVVKRGYPGLSITFPHVLGADIAGIITAVGSGVPESLIGQKVIVYPLVSCGTCHLCQKGKRNLCLRWKYFGMHLDGGYREKIAVPVDNIIPIPDRISFEEAACLPVAGLTAFHALTTVGNLRQDDTFLVWGGSGGVGTMAIQIAKTLGATVITTTGSPEKAEHLYRIGADYVFDRKTPDLAEKIKEVVPHGLDVILDYVGSQTFPTSFNLLKKGGTMLLCGMLTGRETTLSIHLTYLNHLSIKGLYLGTREELERLVEWVAEGRVKPVISRVLPLEKASLGHDLMKRSQHLGKIVLRP